MQKYSKEELTGFQQQISQAKNRSILGLGLIVTGVFLFIFNIFTSASVFMIVVMVLFLVAGFILYSRSNSQIKNKVGVVIAGRVMDSLFDRYEYKPSVHISDSVIDNTRIPYLGRYEKIRGNDYISGVYQGLNFEMSDIRLSRTETTTDSKGHTTTREVIVFNGLWFICDFAKEIKATVTVSPRPAISFGKGVKTEYEEFNKTFYIESDNAHDAFYILTPHLMERVLSTYHEADCKMYFVFEKTGRVHILINKGNSLEINALTSSVEKIEEQYSRELHQVTDIVDELKLTEAYH